MASVELERNGSEALLEYDDVRELHEEVDRWKGGTPSVEEEAEVRSSIGG